jgi:regulator of protease activity HflC (stomatin/prohibitin superfamily)
VEYRTGLLNGGASILFIVIIFTSLILGTGFMYRNYHVWSERKVGEAELARAESNRKIKTLEAKAVEESAHHLAHSEIIRAHGVAEANKIIGESLKESENYLKYLWITTLENRDKQIIYVPTEANLPILEAGKR